MNIYEIVKYKIGKPKIETVTIRIEKGSALSCVIPIFEFYGAPYSGGWRLWLVTIIHYHPIAFAHCWVGWLSGGIPWYTYLSNMLVSWDDIPNGKIN